MLHGTLPACQPAHAPLASFQSHVVQAGTHAGEEAGGGTKIKWLEQIVNAKS